MAKPKQIKDAVRLSIVLSRAQANQLKYMARQMSPMDRTVSASEAARMAIEAAYPMPYNQLDL